MFLAKIRVKNFRSILDETLACDRLTALVGRNGAGKSSFLRALELFYEPAARVKDEDFYAENTGCEIEIAVTFSDLSAAAQEQFRSYLDGDTLTVTRVFRGGTSRSGGTYHGTRRQYPVFSDIRGAPSKQETNRRYRALRQNPAYADLPAARSADAAEAALEEWETENPALCVPMRDDGQFFGFTNVARGYLGRYTSFIRVPAVRDALTDATEGRGSNLTAIMNLITRSALSERADIESFQRNVQAKYEELLDPERLPELLNLGERLTQTLSRYAPEASASLTWSGFAPISVAMPAAEVRLCEDGYESPVGQTGHGLQRAFIFTMLEHLVGSQKQPVAVSEVSNQAERIPNVVFAIEEPEIYQHPGRQRHLASVLLKLAEGSVPGVAASTQVIYTTHAPLFVGLDRFDQVRVLRKRSIEEGRPAATAVASATLEEIAQRLASLYGRPPGTYTSESLRPRMQALMTPWMNEGFFADVVALVEGEGDRLALLAVAEAEECDLEALGVCVVPCNGKPNMDRPAVVFQALGIATYLVWDNDRGKGNTAAEANRILLELVGGRIEDWPVGVWDTHACLEGNLERALRREIGEDLFLELVDECCSLFEMNRREAQKNAVVLKTVIEKASVRKCRGSTLAEIVGSLAALKESVRR